MNTKYLISLFLGFLTACGHGTVAEKKIEQNVVVVAAPAKSVSVNPMFLGFSYEKSSLSTKFFEKRNVELHQLLTRLGPGVLRLGGNSVDRTTWKANGPGAEKKKVAQPDIRRLAGFLKDTQWKVIYGINLAKNTPENAANEAAFVAETLGDALIGFEIGNEPDLYYKNHLRDSDYKYEDFKKEWETYAVAIRKQVSKAVFTGPTSSSHFGEYTGPFAKDEAQLNSILNHHYYRADGKASTSTVDFLLSPDPKLHELLKSLHTAAQSANLSGGYRLAECNSFYHSGREGVSDSFGSALWAIDFLFANVEEGSAGINFHGGSDSAYSPIMDDDHGHVTQVKPLYYAMMMFSKMANGTLLQTSIGNSPKDVSGYSVEDKDGSYWILLNNKDRAAVQSLKLTLPKSLKGAEVFSLEGPSLESTSNYTLAGATVGADGSWSLVKTLMPVDGNSVSVIVIPASALLVHAW